MGQVAGFVAGHELSGSLLGTGRLIVGLCTALREWRTDRWTRERRNLGPATWAPNCHYGRL